MEEKQKFSVAIRSDAYQNLINNTLGDKEVARKFVAEISSVVSNNPLIAECDAGSILSAGLTAQTLNLPLSSSLGFCYIVPFRTRDANGNYVKKAQFQVGWKGFVQLAQRSGQFETIGVRPVHKGEYNGQDEFGDDKFTFSHDYDDNEIVGYFSYFKLINGFKKTLYWTKEQCEKHAKTYSKSYGTGKSTDLWTNQFDMMAQKTVLRQLLSKYAPMSIDMQLAYKADQSAINTNGTYEYVDNPSSEINKKSVNNTIDEVDNNSDEIVIPDIAFDVAEQNESR